MATKRKDGRYQISLTISGKRMYFYGSSPAEVNRNLRAYKAVQEKGLLFSAVCDLWQEEHFPKLRIGTVKSYESASKRCLKHFGDDPIRQISALDIDRFIRDLSSGDRAAQTVRIHLQVMRLIFNYALRNGLTESNPASVIKVPKGLPRRVRVAPDEKYIEIVKRSAHQPFGLFALFLLYTGCRRGEALAVCHEDIDGRIIHINKSIVYDGNKPILQPYTKTASGVRDVVLLDDLAEKIPPGKGLLFSFNGKPITEMGLQRRWEKYCKDTGMLVPNEPGKKPDMIPAFTPHQLRHAYATILFEAGVDEMVAKDLLGHSDIAVTKNIYTHIRQKKRDVAFQQLNDYIKINSGSN